MTTVEKLELILSEFKEQISPEQFGFKRFVTEWDEENNCGTVCCIAGWFPKLFPNSGFYWEKDDQNLHTETGLSVERHLIELLGLTTEEIDYLFYGASEYFDEVLDYELTNKSSYQEVIEGWEKFIEWKKGDPENIESKYSLS